MSACQKFDVNRAFLNYSGLHSACISNEIFWNRVEKWTF